MMNEQAFQFLLAAEGPGGKAEPGDPGKLTVFGITKRYEPTWEGWAYWAQLQASGVAWQHDEKLLTLVSSYYEGVWDKMNLDGVKTPELAACLLGGYVNQGPKVIGWLQSILGLVSDEDLGPVTLLAVGAREQAGRGLDLFRELALKRIKYYAETAKDDFLRGLVLRVFHSA